MKIKILPGYPSYNLKLQQYDIALIVGFIFCCVMIAYLSWSVAVPETIEHPAYSTSVIWTVTTSKCYAGPISWDARNGVCFMEDMGK